MTDSNFQAGFFGQYGKLFLPQTHPAAVTSASIASDQQPLCSGKVYASNMLPPCPNTLDSKFTGITAFGQIHKTCVVVQHIHAIRSYFPHLL